MKNSCLFFWSLGAGLLGCTPSIDDYPLDLAEAVCAWQHGCHQYERESDCLEVSRIVGDPQYEYLRRAVSAGLVEYDRAAAAACLDAIRGQTCEYVEAEPEACKGVFRGLTERNGPCMTAAECAGDAVCGFDPRCAPDTCCVGACRVFAEPIKVGEACSFGGGAGCVPEGFCASDPMTGQATVCTARVGLGGDCSSGQGCAADTYCDGSRCGELLAPGGNCGGVGDDACAGDGVCRGRNDGRVMCVVEAQLGAPCEQDVGCARFDTFCDETSKLCTLLPGPGQACASSECLPYAQCQRAEEAETCVPWPEEGDACGVVTGGGPFGEDRYVECGAPLECVDDVCKAPEAVPPAMSCPLPEAG